MNHFCAIIFVIGGAQSALVARIYLSTNADPVANLDSFDLRTHANRLPDDLMTTVDKNSEISSYD